MEEKIVILSKLTVKKLYGNYDYDVKFNADVTLLYGTNGCSILGTPVWWYTFAPAMNSFLHSADLSEKSVYPFATNGGWIGHTFKDFENACKGASVHAGLNVRFNEEKQITSDDEIQKWAKQIAK